MHYLSLLTNKQKLLGSGSQLFEVLNGGDMKIHSSALKIPILFPLFFKKIFLHFCSTSYHQSTLGS